MTFFFQAELYILNIFFFISLAILPYIIMLAFFKIHMKLIYYARDERKYLLTIRETIKARFTYFPVKEKGRNSTKFQKKGILKIFSTFPNIFFSPPL